MQNFFKETSTVKAGVQNFQLEQPEQVLGEVPLGFGIVVEDKSFMYIDDRVMGSANWIELCTLTFHAFYYSWPNKGRTSTTPQPSKHVQKVCEMSPSNGSKKSTDLLSKHITMSHPLLTSCTLSSDCIYGLYINRSLLLICSRA